MRKLRPVKSSGGTIAPATTKIQWWASSCSISNGHGGAGDGISVLRCKEFQMPSVAAAHRFIVVEGTDCVGNPAWSAGLSQILAGPVVLEQAEQDPFLESRFSKSRAAAFPTAICSSCFRPGAFSWRDVRQQICSGAVRVADYCWGRIGVCEVHWTIGRINARIWNASTSAWSWTRPSRTGRLTWQAPVDVWWIASNKRRGSR